jgi:hypothetical protein
MDPGSLSGVTVSFSDAVSIVRMLTPASLAKLGSNGAVLDKLLILKSHSWINLRELMCVQEKREVRFA